MKENVDPITEIKELIEQKKKKVQSTADIEKINYIENAIKESGCFFKLDYKVIIGIFRFLEVSEEDMLKLYTKLTSQEEYLKAFPKIRYVIEKRVE